jgi:hypothetical protein
MRLKRLRESIEDMILQTPDTIYIVEALEKEQRRKWSQLEGYGHKPYAPPWPAKSTQ